MPIQLPGRKMNKPLGGIIGAAGTVIGAGIGAAVGGPAGALAGASAGGALGGVGGTVTDLARGQPEQVAPLSTDQNAMQRRMAELNQGSEKLAALRDGITALPEVDPQTRAQAAPVLMKAYVDQLNSRYGA